MKKQLTEKQFTSAIKRLEISQQTVEIAYGVLVDGKSQSFYVSKLGISKGAVSQAVNRVWITAQAILPTGFERVTAVLPSYQAFIVKKWANQLKGDS